MAAAPQMFGYAASLSTRLTSNFLGSMKTHFNTVTTHLHTDGVYRDNYHCTAITLHYIIYTHLYIHCPLCTTSCQVASVAHIDQACSALKMAKRYMAETCTSFVQ
jgi:hypothetical protein